MPYTCRMHILDFYCTDMQDFRSSGAFVGLSLKRILKVRNMSSEYVDRDGCIVCISCNKQKCRPQDDYDQCARCDKFVCMNCATYHRQSPHGYHCKECNKL
jgi:hypothetical protein